MSEEPTSERISGEVLTAVAYGVTRLKAWPKTGQPDSYKGPAPEKSKGKPKDGE